ncbi:MAG: protein kinase, partial [Acidobacteriota bacterium]
MTQKLGKYTVVEKLGEGAMGAVYKAYDEVLDRYVAIKTMAEDIKWDPELKLRFYREARSAAGLHHPNIVTIHDLGEDGKITYIVMEVLQGQDLKAIIKSQAPVALEKKLSFIAQVADGLYHAHLKGIIHRDIKPGNIHVSPAGNVKILDFGIARIPSSDLTRSGARLGTPIYMSPEQIRGGDYDERSDLFSTGIVFYELVTYHHPFRDKNIAKTLDNILFQTRLPFAEQFPEAPAGLWEIIQTCLAKEPDQRYGSMAELAKACRNLLVDLNLASQRTWKQIQAALPLWRQAKLEGQAAQARDAALQQLDASGRQAEIPDYCALRRLLAALPENLAAAPPATPPAVPIPVRDMPPIPVPAPRSEATGTAPQPEAPKPLPSPPTPGQIRGREMLEAGKGKLRDGLLDEALEQLRGAMAALGPQEEVVQALVETRRSIEGRKSARIQEILGAARRHLEEKEYAQALGKIDEALAADPESFPAAELQRKVLAEQEAEQERRRRRTEGEAKKALGLGLIAEERFRDSLEPLEQAAELLGGDAEVQAALQQAREAVHAAELEQRVAAELAQARELLAVEAFDKARRHARFVLELSPDNPEARQLLSELERIEGENRRRALLSDHLARCRDAVGRKDWDAAARHSQEALQLDP